MTGILVRLLLIAPLALTSCARIPARVCLTPPYDAPAGFSETYHAALAHQEPILLSGDAIPVESSRIVGPPIFIWPGAGSTAAPPIEW